jgi:hypothetical protein
MDASSLYVYVNGDRFPLLEDRRLSVATHFQLGTTILDAFYNPPRAVPMSQDANEAGVTAAKLQPYGRYLADPPTHPQCIVVHNLPESADGQQLAKFFDGRFDNCYVYKADVFRWDNSKRHKLRGYVMLTDPRQNALLAGMKQLNWDRIPGHVVYLEEGDWKGPLPQVQQPMLPPMPHQMPPALFDPAMLGANRRGGAGPPVPGGGKGRGGGVAQPHMVIFGFYFIVHLKCSTDEAQHQVNSGTFLTATVHAKEYDMAYQKGPVRLIAVVPGKEEIFGFAMFDSFVALPGGAQAECKVHWMNSGLSIRRSDTERVVGNLNCMSMPDGTPMKPELGEGLCGLMTRAGDTPANIAVNNDALGALGLQAASNTAGGRGGARGRGGAVASGNRR